MRDLILTNCLCRVRIPPVLCCHHHPHALVCVHCHIRDNPLPIYTCICVLEKQNPLWSSLRLSLTGCCVAYRTLARGRGYSYHWSLEPSSVQRIHHYTADYLSNAKTESLLLASVVTCTVKLCDNSSQISSMQALKREEVTVFYLSSGPFETAFAKALLFFG